MRVGYFLASVLVAASCRTSGPRAPQPAAQEGLVNASVGVTYEAAVEALSQEGIQLRRLDPDRRTIDTEYFDVASYTPTAESYPVNERVIRFQITVEADTLGRGSQVAIRALYLPFGTSGVYSERSERAIPRGHPGFEIVRKVFDRIRAIASG